MKREHTAGEFKMDPSLPVLLVAERADSYGFYLCKAQHLSEQDKQRFSDDWKERILHPVSEEVELKHMHCEDFYSVVQTSQYEGAFLGCSNQVYSISQEQWDQLLATDARRSMERAEKEKQEEVESLRIQKQQAEHQMQDGRLPDRDGARRLRKQYNDTYNEGGEGFVPHFFFQEEYLSICSRLTELEQN